MSEGFGPREGKIADPVRLVESVFEFEGINIPKGSKKPSFVQFDKDVNKNTVTNNLKKFELLPDIGTSFACVFADISGGNSWFDAFLMSMSPKYRNLSVKDRQGVAQGFRKECAKISDLILEQIPDDFFDAFDVDAKKIEGFKSELEGSKDINMGFGFFIAWYFGLNLVYLIQPPSGHEIISASCYQSEECHAIFMKKHLNRFNAVVVLNLDKEEYDEEESTSVFEWTDKRLCKLKELSTKVENDYIDTSWYFPISKDCEDTKENARNINPFSNANKKKADEFFKEEENSPKLGKTPPPSGTSGTPALSGTSGTPAPSGTSGTPAPSGTSGTPTQTRTIKGPPNKKFKIGDTVRCRVSEGVQESKPFVIDTYLLMPNNKWKVLGLDKSGKKREYGESGCELVNNLSPPPSSLTSLSEPDSGSKIAYNPPKPGPRPKNNGSGAPSSEAPSPSSGAPSPRAPSPRAPSPGAPSSGAPSPSSGAPSRGASPNTTRRNNAVKRNNTSKLRIRAPSNDVINKVEKSKRKTTFSKTRPSKFKKPNTRLIHRTEATGLAGPFAPASSNMYKKGKRSRKNR